MFKKIKAPLRIAAVVIPPAIFIKNRVDKGQPSHSLPDKRHVLVIGGGIVGLSMSYYLSSDANTKVTLLEKNKSVMLEFSGQDSALFMKDQNGLRTFGG